jgi:hypothetical protein
MSIMSYPKNLDRPELREAAEIDHRFVHISQCKRLLNILPQVVAHCVQLCKPLESHFKLLSRSVLIRVDLGIEFHPLGEDDGDNDDPYTSYVPSSAPASPPGPNSDRDSRFSYLGQLNLPPPAKLQAQDKKLLILERDNMAARRTIKSSLTGLWQETISVIDSPHSLLAGGNCDLVSVSTVLSQDGSQVCQTMLVTPQKKQKAKKDWYRIILNEVTTSLDINWFAQVCLCLLIFNLNIFPIMRLICI